MIKGKAIVLGNNVDTDQIIRGRYLSMATYKEMLPYCFMNSKNFCENYKEEIDVEDYNHIFDFIQSFFEDLNNEEHTIDLSTSSLHDIDNMMKCNNEIIEKLQKKEDLSHDPEETKICISKEMNENSSIDERNKNINANQDFHNLHNVSLQFEEQMQKINVDVEIASQTYELLSSGAHTLQEITNYICQYIDPEDFNNETTPLKIEMHIERLNMNDYIDFNSNKYELQDSFIELVKEGESSC